jgi:hypothetical protein
MSTHARPLAALAALGCVLAATGPSAAGGAKHVVPGLPAAAPQMGKAAPALAVGGLGRPPRGYAVVDSGWLTAADGVQTRGTVACPATTVPFGGGVFVSSTSLAANVNSSIPSGNGWLADVNNASGAATTFRVTAICARQPAGYQIVTATVPNPFGEQDHASAACPARTVVLGGGAYSSSAELWADVNSTYPTGTRGWQLFMNNDTPDDATATVYAICGRKPRGYAVIAGPYGPALPGQQSLASASCQAPSVPISGGSHGTSPELDDDVNTSSPSGQTWVTYFDHNAECCDFDLVDSWVICAGA